MEESEVIEDLNSLLDEYRIAVSQEEQASHTDAFTVHMAHINTLKIQSRMAKAISQLGFECSVSSFLEVAKGFDHLKMDY